MGRRNWWGESVSTEEAEQADRFWETLVGDGGGAEKAVFGPQTSRRRTRAQRLTQRCILPNRITEFRANLTPTNAVPRMEICKIIVTKRSSAIAGAPVADADGRPAENAEPDDTPGAGGLTPSTARANVGTLIQEVGTGFFIGRDRIVTAGHVVLDATQVIVIPGKMGARPPGSVGGGTGGSTGGGGSGPTPPTPVEPFGRFTVAASNIAISPGLLAAVTNPSGTSREFFSEDLAVIRGFNTPFPPAPGRSFGSIYKLDGMPRPNKCVHTCGYSAVPPVDGNFQHCDTGFHHPLLPVPIPSGPQLLDFDLVNTKGASGSPIWHGPAPKTGGTTRRRVIGVVAMGTSTTHTGSPLLTQQRMAFLRTA